MGGSQTMRPLHSFHTFCVAFPGNPKKILKIKIWDFQLVHTHYNNNNKYKTRVAGTHFSFRRWCIPQLFTFFSSLFKPATFSYLCLSSSTPHPPRGPPVLFLSYICMLVMTYICMIFYLRICTVCTGWSNFYTYLRKKNFFLREGVGRVVGRQKKLYYKACNFFFKSFFKKNIHIYILSFSKLLGKLFYVSFKNRTLPPTPQPTTSPLLLLHPPLSSYMFVCLLFLDIYVLYGRGNSGGGTFVCVYVQSTHTYIHTRTYIYQIPHNLQSHELIDSYTYVHIPNQT